MSVATGTAQPWRVPPPSTLMTMKTSAGPAMPQAAAVIGTIASAGRRRLPSVNSRLSSRPEMKKKTVSRPSEAHSATVYGPIGYSTKAS